MPRSEDQSIGVAPRSRVLLGLTDPESRERVVGAIRAAGFDPIESEDGASTLRLARDLRPDLVILDVATSWALDVCGALHEASRTAMIPVLVLVTASETASLTLSDDVGVVDFITRPVEVALLTRRLHSLVRATQMMRRLHLSEMRLARVQRIAHLGSWVRGLEGRALHLDDELTRILAVDRGRVLDPLTDMLARVHPEDRPDVEAAMEAMLPHRLEYRVVVAQGDEPPTTRSLQQEAWLVQDEPGGEVELVGTVLDITLLKEAQQKVARLAYFDVLTGLPNRAFLKEFLQLTLARGRRFGGSVAVLALDLDFFKRVNDSLGHPAGDVLLTVVAQRICATVRTSDVLGWSGPGDERRVLDNDNTVARIGGDEFIVVLTDLRAAEDAALAARRIIDALVRPVTIAGTDVFSGCSIGIAIYPDNGDTPDQLIKNADTALYHAKELGRGGYHFFGEELAQRARRRMDIEGGLRAALAGEQLLLHYQPKIDLASRTVMSCEALLRWPIGDGRFIPPDHFIPIAEDSGLILELGEWVLRTACRQAKLWCDRLPRPLAVAVNVSARQLAEASFEAVVAGVLAGSGLPGHLLDIEITEGALLRDARACATLLGRLKLQDVRITLDDFGTGYSSLSYLTRLPIDQLKIDRSFVSELGGEPNASSAIAIAILALSRATSLKVIAEGVETQAQLDFLVSHGCDEAQGYFFARPMPADALEHWLATSHSLAPR